MSAHGSTRCVRPDAPVIRYRAGAALPVSQSRWNVREWGDECVVFDGKTGACHLLSEHAGAIFMALLASAGAGMSAAELCMRVFGSDPDQEWHEGEQAVGALLAGLHDAGLVQEASA